MLNQSVLTGEYDHYYSGDPAFDTSTSTFDHQRWVETRDEKFLPKKDGARPVKFTLRRLNSKQKRHLLDVHDRNGLNVMTWWAVALSVVAIDPLVVDGKDEEISSTTDGGWRRIDDKWIDLIEAFDGGNLFLELAMRVQYETFPSLRR